MYGAKSNYVLLSNVKQGIFKTSNFLICSIADPDPGSGEVVDPWIRDPGWKKNKDPYPV
jgi:hypothetical protein